MKIDVHNHFYPQAYLDELAKTGPALGFTVEKDEWGRTVMAQDGNRFVTITEPMTNVDLRLEDMEKSGVDVQILTLTAPSVDNLPGELAGTMARVANEALALVIQDHPKNFRAFATLPYLDPDAAVQELEYCLNELGFKGACIGSNINGVNLDDPILFPFYEIMSQNRLPIHIHPRTPVDKGTFKDYRMVPMLGFEIDLCVAVVRLIMGGILDKYPGLNFIVSHLGGAIPYLTARIQNCYTVYPECRQNISKEAESYLHQFYWDSVSFHIPALMCAYHSFGPERIVLGSDYPHVIGDTFRAVTTVEEMPIPDEEKEMIFSANLVALMGE